MFFSFFLHQERQDDMQRQRFRLDTFNEQSKKLINRYPELESEVSWLTKHINDKWETVECMMGVSKKGEGEKRCELGSQEKVEHEVKCLRRWLRELDTKLKPLSFQYGWTKAELEMKTKEHMVSSVPPFFFRIFFFSLCECGLYVLEMNKSSCFFFCSCKVCFASWIPTRLEVGSS